MYTGSQANIYSDKRIYSYADIQTNISNEGRVNTYDNEPTNFYSDGGHVAEVRTDSHRQL